MNMDAEAMAARHAWELAVSRDDAQSTLEASKRMQSVLERDPNYRVLALIPGADSRAPGDDFGKPFPARFAGRCIVCDQAVAEGVSIRLRSVDRAVAHSHCAGGA